MSDRQLTISELKEVLDFHIEMGGGDDPVFVSVNFHDQPLLQVEPGDGLESLYLIGFGK